MKKTKIAAALMIMTAGSVLLAGNTAGAEEVKASRHHGHMPPPREFREPPHHGPHNPPPPPHEWRGHPHHGPHNPPPPPEWRGHPHHGPHNPPPPHHHGPHNPPPPHHRGPHGRDIGVEPRW